MLPARQQQQRQLYEARSAQGMAATQCTAAASRAALGMLSDTVTATALLVTAATAGQGTAPAHISSICDINSCRGNMCGNTSCCSSYGCRISCSINSHDPTVRFSSSNFRQSISRSRSRFGQQVSGSINSFEHSFSCSINSLEQSICCSCNSCTEGQRVKLQKNRLVAEAVIVCCVAGLQSSAVAAVTADKCCAGSTGITTSMVMDQQNHQQQQWQRLLQTICSMYRKHSHHKPCNMPQQCNSNRTLTRSPRWRSGVCRA